MGFEERLTRGRNGDPAALDQLFQRWRLLLRLQARKLLGAELSARVDPSDVVQEALTQAFQSLNQFRGRTEEEWVGCLRSIVTGQAAKMRRNHRAENGAAGCDQACPRPARP